MVSRSKKLRVHLFSLLVSLSTTAVGQGVRFSQLPKEFTLRDLQRVCAEPILQDKLSSYHRQGIEQVRAKLHLNLRRYMLERSLTLQKKMALYYSHRTFPQAYFPDSCSAIDQQFVTVRKQHDQLQETHGHLQNTVRLRWRDGIRTLLTASYELMFIKYVLLRGKWNSPRTRNWQKSPFWPDDIKRIDLVSFPPLYPIDLVKMQFGYPQQRVEAIYRDHPLLRWRGMKRLSLYGQSLDHKIFELAFIEPKSNVIDRLRNDFAGKLAQLLTRVDALSVPSEVIIKTAKQQELVLSPDQVRVLRALQLYLVGHFRNDIASYVAEVDEQKLQVIAREIDHNYVDWLREQEMVRESACHAPASDLEEYRSLLWSLLNNYDEDDSLELLAAFCHQSWSRTGRRLVEANSHIVSGIAFVAGILSKRLRPVAIPLSSTLSAYHFLARGLQGIEHLHLERALLLVDMQEESNRIYNNYFNLLASPVSFISLLWGAQAIVKTGQGWRFFIPLNKPGKGVGPQVAIGFAVSRVADAKSHLDRQLNPLTTKNFWLNSFDAVLSAMILGHALGNTKTLGGRLRAAGLTSLTYALFNVYAQNFYYLAFRDEITPENHKFNNMWGLFHSSIRNVAEYSLFHWWNGHANWALQLFKMVDSLQKKVWYADAKLAYLKEDKNFFEAFLGSLDNWEGYNLLQIRQIEPTSPPSIEEVNSLSELIKAYSPTFNNYTLN